MVVYWSRNRVIWIYPWNYNHKKHLIWNIEIDMARMKIEYNVDQEIEYTSEQWEILKNLRTRAMHIKEIFARHNIESLTFGSVARGDVKSTSDIDIVLLTKVPTFHVEVLLDEAKERIQAKTIVQATPNDVIKAHYDLDDEKLHKLVDFQIAGNGIGGIGRFPKYNDNKDFDQDSEELNQSFLIQIIPKIGEMKVE